MSSLTRIALTAGSWIDVTAEMVSSNRYRMIATGGEWPTRFAEFATTPTSTTGYVDRAIGKPVDYLYDGTAIYAYTEGPDTTLNIVTLAN